MAVKSEIIERRYVTGVDWRQSIQRVDLKKDALARARKQRANWYCVAGTNTTGVASLKVRLAKDEELRPLAVGYAALCGHGFGFAALRLDDGRVWICGSIDGVPASGYDQIVSDDQAAQNLYRSFASQVTPDTPVSLHSNAPELLDMAEQTAFVELTRIISAAADQPAMLKVGASLPKPALYALGLLIVGYGTNATLTWWQNEQARKAAEAAQAAAYVEPVQAWQHAYTAYAQTQPAVGPDALQALRIMIDTLPTSIAGWRLSVVECASDVAAWSCTLDYQRTKDIGLDPSNAEFEQLRPKDWSSIQFPSLDQATAAVTVAIQSQPLDIERLATLRVMQLDGISTFQKVLRAFSRQEIGAFAEETIIAPVDNAGQPVPRPAELELAIFKAPVQISGPLRSVDLFVTPSIPVAWRTFKLEVARVPLNWQAEGQATLTDSLLQASLTGEIYAKR